MADKNTANIGFEKQIWDAACVLRGNMDASEYKNVVLGLIFLKYISDRFEEKYQELVSEGDGFEEDVDEYTSEGIFFVPVGARWSEIASKAHTPEIGTIIDDAMRAIEKENKRLKDILPKNFARPELDKRRLGDVVDLFTNIQMVEHGSEKDILGRTYEYCLSMFAEQEGKRTDGRTLELDNPTNYPDPATIESSEEPYVLASIFTPTQYIGSIMDLCQQRRGIYRDTKYLEADRAELHYELPLGEIIYDFFDALKSRTRGYASFDYEPCGYKPGKLVKLDVLLNGEQVDALSMIVFAENAYPRARRMVERLRDNISRQLFEVPVQAAIGGKIIARETVKALRKDVLAKCYGGDITRKKKLLEKQKEGKKKMRRIGSVELPKEAFMAVLKLDDD